MAIQCIFFVEGQPQPCQVLQVAGSPLPVRTCERLQQTFCAGGTFINCPVFARVERGLITMRRRLEVGGEPEPQGFMQGARIARVA